MRKLLRRCWHAVNPKWLGFRRRLERLRIRTQTLPSQWLRRNWPAAGAPEQGHDRVSIVTVNYNTAENVAHLLFSIFRILGRDRIVEVVVVDNASTDGSVELLQAMHGAGLIQLIANAKQRYHGPALNQGMNYLAARARAAQPEHRGGRYVWILDSDAIVLRPEALLHSLAAARRERAALLGQFEFNSAVAPHGYAHVSSLLVDVFQVWRRSVVPFEESGSPATGLHCSLLRRGRIIADFPFMSGQFVLHLGQGTLSQIHAAGERSNPYFEWAESGHGSSFHFNPHGPEIYQRFLAVFAQEVGLLSPATLVAACLREPLLALTLPPLGAAPPAPAAPSPSAPGAPGH